MSKDQAQQKTSPNREKVINEFLEHLNADGTPGEVVLAFKILGESCFYAYQAGLMAARRMELEQQIRPEQVFEVAMEFAKIIAMKITITPQPSQIMRPVAGAGADVQPGRLEPSRR